MTNIGLSKQDLNDIAGFDTTVFLQPGYEKERKYMVYLTATALSAINSTIGNHRTAKVGPSGKLEVAPNKENGWLNSNKHLTLLRPIGELPLGDHADANKFILNYEILLKKFLNTYHANYSNVSNEFLENYYTIQYLIDNYNGIVELKPDANIYACTLKKFIVDSNAFLDLRIPLLFSYDEPNAVAFVENSYSSDMVQIWENANTISNSSRENLLTFVNEKCQLKTQNNNFTNKRLK